MTVPQPSQQDQPMREYSSVTEFLESETLENVGATINTDANGDTVITARIRLADDPEDESVDISALDNAEIERLREADPFMYHSIVRERRRSSLFGLEEDLEADDAAVQNIEFDLREMDTMGGGGLRSSLRGSLRGSFRRQGLRGSLVSDDGLTAEQSRNNSDGASSASNNSGSNQSGGRPNGQRGPPRAGHSRRRSSLYNVEEGEESITQADTGGGVSARQHRPFTQSLQPQRPNLDANGEPLTGGAQRRNSYGNRSPGVRSRDTHCRRHSSSVISTGTGSSVIQRKRRFSTEAHSSLVMANLEASLRGSILNDSPDLDSLFDDAGDSSDDDGELLGFLRPE